MNAIKEPINFLADFPDTARVWIYQSDRNFSDEECAEIEAWGEEFAAKWVAHKRKLRARVEIVYNSIIVVAVDEQIAPVSGCAQDDMMHFVRFVENELGCALLDRNLVLYRSEDVLKRTQLNDLHTQVDLGKLNENTLVVDPLAGNLGDVRAKLLRPINDSWHNRFI